MTTEVPQKFWEPFCERLNDWHRGAVSIRSVLPGGAEEVVAENTPLQKLVFQKRDNTCSDMMIVETGPPDERPNQHQIVEPFSIILKKNDESGRYNELDILAETGKTEIHFTPGLDSRILAKLAA